MARQDVSTRTVHLEGAIRGLSQLAGGRVLARSESGWCYCTDASHNDGRGGTVIGETPQGDGHPVTRRELTVFTAWQDDAP